jgi:hypothetical protein
MSQSSAPKPVISFRDWNTSSVMYMSPKINDRGGKSINVISNQSKRSLHISTPLMMTWGINDFVDDKGESDGKYSISLQFPNEDYKTKECDDFLKKLKDFENQILDDAVNNSDKWWGEDISRDVLKHTYFPFLKYSKNKETKKVDLSKPPAIRAKVPFYNGKWAVEIYNTNLELIFPCSNEMMSPVDFVQKMSNVACVIQCSGIWIGGKGWGVTWKMIQCVVKPREVVSVYGKCHVELSVDDMEKMDKPLVKNAEHEDEEEVVLAATAKVEPVSTVVVDSDDEEVEEPPAAVPEEVVLSSPAPIVKKTIKKAVVAQPVVAAVEESTHVDAAVEEAPKKKIIKKKPV